MTTPETPATAPIASAAKGLAIAALVLGIVAFLLGFIPILGILVGIGGVVVGILALVRKQSKGFAVTGLALAAVGAITSLIFTIGLGALLASSAGSGIEVSPEPQQSSAQESLPTPEPAPTPTTPDLTTFGELDERTLALIAKDPAAYEGTNAIVYGKITQYDSFTGKCGIRLDLSHTVQEYSYDYEHNTIASSGDGEANCPVLDPLVQDDIVKLWVTVLGAYSYDTTIGGTATAIAVEVWQAEILPKPEY